MGSLQFVALVLITFNIFIQPLGYSYGCATELPAVSPKFVWAAINMTLIENKVPWYCPKLVFHSNDTVAAAEFGSPSYGAQYAGLVPNVYVAITPQVDNDQEWDTAEQQLHLAALRQIHEKFDPCLIVISFVFNATNEVTLLKNPESVQNELEANATADLSNGGGNEFEDEPPELVEIDTNVEAHADAIQHSYSLTHNLHSPKSSMKYKLRHRVADLLQYSTPAKMRHLLLTRLSMDMADLRYCTRAPKYPVRLVPEWEMVLYEYFAEAHVIQGLFYDDKPPYIKVGKEHGKWKWLCEDVMHRLELERQCRMNHECLMELNPEYYEKKLWMSPSVGGGSKKRGEVICKHGYRPRH